MPDDHVQDQAGDAEAAEPTQPPADIADAGEAPEPSAKSKRAKKQAQAASVDARAAEFAQAQAALRDQQAQGRPRRMQALASAFEALLVHRAHARWGDPARLSEPELWQKLAETIEQVQGELGADAPEIAAAHAAMKVE